MVHIVSELQASVEYCGNIKAVAWTPHREVHVQTHVVTGVCGSSERDEHTLADPRQI